MKYLTSNIIIVSNVFSFICFNNFNVVMTSVHCEGTECPDGPWDIQEVSFWLRLKLIVHFSLEPRLRMCGAIPRFPTHLYVIVLN